MVLAKDGCVVESARDVIYAAHPYDAELFHSFFLATVIAGFSRRPVGAMASGITDVLKQGRSQDLVSGGRLVQIKKLIRVRLVICMGPDKSLPLATSLFSKRRILYYILMSAA